MADDVQDQPQLTGTYLDDLPSEMRPQQPQAPSPPWEPTGTYLDDLPPELRPHPQQVKQRLQQDMLQSQRDKLADKQETMGSYILRRWTPGGATAMQVKQDLAYSASLKKFQEGTANPDDTKVIAAYEKTKQLDEQQNQTFRGKALSALQGATVMGGEMLATGPVLRWAGLGVQAGAKVSVPLYTGRLAVGTALTPSFYAKTWTDANMEQGRYPLDPRGLPAAYGVALVQNAILGQLSNQAKIFQGPGVGNLVGRLGTKGAIGAGEQAGADVATGFLQDQVRKVLPLWTRKETHYGTLGDLASGKYGEGLQNAVIQAITFGVFGGLHELTEGTPQQRRDRAIGLAKKNTIDSLANHLDDMGKNGMQTREAGDGVGALGDSLGLFLQDNPNPTRPEVQRYLKGLTREGTTLRAYADAMAEKFPENGAPPKAGPSGGAPGGPPGGMPSGAPAREALPPRLSPELENEGAATFAKFGRLGLSVEGAKQATRKSRPELANWVPETDRGPTLEEMEQQLRAQQIDPEKVRKRVELSGATTAEEWYTWARKNKAWLNDPLKSAYAAKLAEQAGGAGQALPAGWKGLSPKRPPGPAAPPEPPPAPPTPPGTQGGPTPPPAPTTPPGAVPGPGEPLPAPGERPAPLPPAPKVGAPSILPPPRPGVPAAYPEKSGPGELKSDLDPITEALGLGKALKEVPAKEPTVTPEGLKAPDLKSLESGAAPETSLNPVQRRVLEVVGNSREGSMTEILDMLNEGKEPEQEMRKVQLREHLDALLDAGIIHQEVAPNGKKVYVRTIKDEAPGSAQLQEIFDKAKLSPVQQSELKDFHEGLTQEEIGAKRGVGRAAVSLSMGKAIAKMEALGGDLPDSMRELKARMQEQNKPEVKNVSAEELSHTQQTAEESSGVRAGELNKLEDQLDALAKKVAKQGGKWTEADRRRHEQLSAAVEGEGSSAERRAAKKGGPAATPPPSPPGTDTGVRSPEQAPEGAKRGQASRSEAAQGPAAQGTGRTPEQTSSDLKSFKSEPFGSGTKPQTERTAMDAARDFLSGESGAVDLDRLKEWASTQYDRLKSAVRHIGDSISELAGKMAPRTTRLNRDTGEALTNLNAVPVHVKEATPNMIDKVLGPKATLQEDALLGTWATEKHLRYTRDAWAKKAQEQGAKLDAARKALAAATDSATKAKAQAAVTKLADSVTEAMNARAGVKSVIGPDSEIKDEAQYQQIDLSPRAQELMKSWAQHMVPVMEQNFRTSQGMEDTDPIRSFTQVPGFPVNLKGLAGKELPEGATKTTGGQGNLKGTYQGKLQFANERKGNADAYDTRLSAMIENSLEHGYTRAAKANLFRVAQENGVGQFGIPGQQVEINGEKTREIPHVFPPKGTQEGAEKGMTSFYVKESAYPEWRAAMKVDQPVGSSTYKTFSDILTRSSLASTVEFMYHSKNLLTFLWKPGVNPLKFFENTWNVLKKDPQTREDLVEMARIGALKGEGAESGLILPAKYKNLDPTYWAGAALDVAQRAMRLTANHAFDQLVKRFPNEIPDTETNRRDFINQLGQYNKQGQHHAIRFLRDSAIGPFATAGSNYWIQGLKTLGGGHGVETTSWKADLNLRAEVYARILGTAGAALALNYLLWKRVDGDEKTPLGAIKLGEKDGKSVYFDLTNLTGLTRGMRETGLLSLVEGERRDQMKGKTIDRAVENIIHSLVHPAVGPGAAFLWTAATGRNTLGMKVAEKPPLGGAESPENVKAAFRTANPTVATLAGWDRPTRPGTEEPVLNRVGRLFGPFGLRETSAVEPVVRNYFDRLRDLSDHRRDSPDRLAGKRFPQEREYQKLQAVAGTMNELNALLKRPNLSEERRAAIRKRQAEIAKRVLAVP